MRPRTAFLAGLALGGFLGFAYLVAGPLTLLPGLVVVAWLLTKRYRAVGLAGSFIGFGAMWMLIIARVIWSCANDPACVVPNASLWLAIGIVILGCGVVIGLAARWQLGRR